MSVSAQKKKRYTFESTPPAHASPLFFPAVNPTTECRPPLLIVSVSIQGLYKGLLWAVFAVLTRLGSAEHSYFLTRNNSSLAMEQQAKAPPEIRKIAQFLRGSGAGLKIRVGALNGKRMDYFKGPSLTDCSDKYLHIF